tara:strand:- start:958 stop:2142 length:1185 start_codon:yes stop_codon:yes gene_type:complete
MTVKVTKPAINVREELADLRKPTGIAGEAMLRAETPQEQFQLIGAGRRNLIINGAMQVAQRGASETGVNTGGYYTCDRMEINISSLGTYTVTQEADAPEGFVNSFKVDCTTADASPSSSNYVFFTHKIEGQNLQHLKKGTANALPVTLSFWVKSNMTGTYQFNARDNDNVRYISASYTINVADTWEYKTLLIAGDTTGAPDNDANESLKLEWWLDSGSNFNSGSLNTSWTAASNANRNVGTTVNIGDSTSNYWQLTGVQLELGKVATPFEHRSYGEELAACQRYYWRAVDVPSNTGNNRYGFYDASPYQTSPTVYGVLKFPVRMRAAPSFTVTNLSSFRMRYGNDLTPTSYNLHGTMNEFYAMPTFVAPTNIAAGRHGWVEAMANATASFDAEL